MTISLRRLAAMGVLQLSLCTFAWAEGTTQDSWISNGKDLGPWWKQSARRFDPLPKPVLYHLEGGISFTKLSGNVDAEMYKADATVFLRKGFFTSTTQISSTLNNTSVNITDKSSKVNKHEVHEGLSYALTNRIALGCGIMWARDNAILLVDRWTYYAGTKAAVLAKLPVFMNVGAYAGYEDDTYDVAEMKKSFITYGPDGGVVFDPFAPFGGIVGGYNSPGIRLMEDVTFPLSKEVVLLHAFDYMLRTKDTAFYHWKGSVTLQAKITPTVTFTTRYQVEYQNILLVERIKDVFGLLNQVQTKKHYEINNTDKVLYTGLQFNL